MVKIVLINWDQLVNFSKKEIKPEEVQQTPSCLINANSGECYYSSERYELTDMQRRVRENYARLRDPTWVTVSCDGTIEDVETEVFNIVIKELTIDKE